MTEALLDHESDASGGREACRVFILAFFLLLLLFFGDIYPDGRFIQGILRSTVNDFGPSRACVCKDGCVRVAYIYLHV